MFDIYDDYAIIDNGAKIGDHVEIGKHAEIGDHVEIGYCAKIGNFAKIGDHAEIGNWAKIGDHAEIGDHVEIGNYVDIGDNVIIGNKFRCECLEVINFFTMSNVDGTGSRIYIYVHTKGITVRAGLFKSTLDEFCNKVKDEGKYLYAVTVRAAAEAFAAEVHRQGKTGGWDK